MKNITFITGNQQKADYLAKWLDIPIPHLKLDLDEIQSLDLQQVAAHKAKQAYAIHGAPVLVEDVSLQFNSLGRLPGTYIKWFLEEIHLDGLCALAGGLANQTAECAIVYVLFDGKDMHFFEAQQSGTIARTPRGASGFGWNPIFIPSGSTLTYGEMDESTFAEWNIRAHAIKKLKAYLTKP